jgi:co-chaperonin GroES (HSP10)
MIRYRVLGSRVLVRQTPSKTNSKLVLPPGKYNPHQIPTYEVVGIGGDVNNDKFHIEVGDTVLIHASHPQDAVGLDDGLRVVDKAIIVAVVEKEEGNG